MDFAARPPLPRARLGEVVALESAGRLGALRRRDGAEQARCRCSSSGWRSSQMESMPGFQGRLVSFEIRRPWRLPALEGLGSSTWQAMEKRWKSMEIKLKINGDA